MEHAEYEGNSSFPDSSVRKNTIADIADRLGVSRSTVSKVINNKPGVGTELRKKIMSVVDELGYRPNSLAQGLIKGHVNIVALVLGDIRNPFYADIAFYMQKMLNDYGYMTMTFSSEYNAEKEESFVEMALQFNFAGLVLISLQSQRLEELFRQKKIPVVMVNRTFEHFEGDRVMLDNFQAGYIATKHLIDLGHTNIAFLSVNQMSSAVSLRYQGYQQVLKNYCMPYCPINQIYSGDLRMDSGREAAKKYLEDIDSLPSALVIANDMMALGFLDYCKSVGLMIPDMLSIVGCDNIIFSSFHGISLTTIDHHAKELSENASRLIINAIEKADHQCERIILEPQLVVRSSTAKYNPHYRDMIREVLLQKKDG